jgi:aspartate racemase
MTQHIGIVAASAEVAALCYRTICAEGSALLGQHAHPEITVHNYPLSRYMPHIDAGRWDEVARLLLSSATKLAAAGADFLICPDDTVHRAFDLVMPRSPLSWLHVAEEVVAVAAQRGYRRVGILGTRYLMEGPVYRSELAAKGVAHEIPDAEDRRHINAIIFDELMYGRIEAPSRLSVAEVIAKLKNQGCNAVVLGCPELPLLVSEAESPLPTLDSTRLLARAALRRAVPSSR